jgi:hypothetical protein
MSDITRNLGLMSSLGELAVGAFGTKTEEVVGAGDLELLVHVGTAQTQLTEAPFVVAADSTHVFVGTTLAVLAVAEFLELLACVVGLVGSGVGCAVGKVA